MPSPRFTAFSILLKIEKEHGYSNLVLDNAINTGDLESRDAAFVTALTYGVLEKEITLDYMIDCFSSRKVTKLQPKVRVLLRLGAYQLLFMNGVPAHAAVSESVKLAKETGCIHASGFVNAVLRKLASNMNALPFPDESKGLPQALSIRYSCPLWLVEKWLADYGEGNTVPLLESLCQSAPSVLRVNTNRITPSELVDRLIEEGINAVPSKREKSAVEVERLPALRDLPSFKDGLFIVQDYASQLCCKAVDPHPGETVLDLCAAPGGKSFTLGFMMEGKGRILACELYENRLRLIDDGARRLGLETMIDTLFNDASVPNPSLGFFDKVLCDVPCSGLGVIRRKPEIRYKKWEIFDLLPDLQYSILCEGARHVALNGLLIYSTCTLSKKENEKVVERFLYEHPHFSPYKLEDCFFSRGKTPDYYVTLFPHLDGTDGFFIARFRKEKGQ